MPDPFEALRTAPTPIDPEPAFAARLRARLARALHPPEQGEPSMTLQTPETTDRLRQGDMSYLSLWVPDLERAARFYADVLGWRYAATRERAARQVEGQSMSLGLGELASAAAFIRGMGVPLPRTLAPTGYVVIVVDDLQAAIQRVRAAGGFAADAKQQPYGLVSACVDDQGLAFTLHEAPSGMPSTRPPSTGARQGDPAYLVFEFPDANRARTFYGSVLGVRFEPGRTPDGWNVPDVAPMSGIAGGAAGVAIVPMWRVDDIQAATERVRAAGGTASQPVHEGYGMRAECSDDQGVRFYLGQL
jgi:predicted enzyme related to lactoylglutathione lyase